MFRRRPNPVRLAKIRDVPGLIAVLDHDAAQYRHEAAKLLGELGDRAAAGPLIARLDDENELVQEAAAKSLGQLGAEEAVDPLVRCLEQGAFSPPDGRRAAWRAVEALAAIGDPRGIAPLVTMWSNGASRVSGLTHIAIPRALAELNAVEPLVAGAADENRARDAIDALTAFDDAVLAPALRAVDAEVVTSHLIQLLNEWAAHGRPAAGVSDSEDKARGFNSARMLRMLWNENVPESALDALNPLVASRLQGRENEHGEWLALRIRAREERREKKAVQTPPQQPGRSDHLEVASVGAAVAHLVALYDAHVDGFVKTSPAADPVRTIGRQLANSGGFQAMLEAHALFADQRPAMARNLEMVWDGVGTWSG